MKIIFKHSKLYVVSFSLDAYMLIQKRSTQQTQICVKNWRALIINS